MQFSSNREDPKKIAPNKRRLQQAMDTGIRPNQSTFAVFQSVENVMYRCFLYTIQTNHAQHSLWLVEYSQQPSREVKQRSHRTHQLPCRVESKKKQWMVHCWLQYKVSVKSYFEKDRLGVFTMRHRAVISCWNSLTDRHLLIQQIAFKLDWETGERLFRNP